MSLFKNMTTNSGLDNSVNALIEGFNFDNVAIADEAFMESACVSLVADIYETAQQFYTAEIIGCAQVVSEGAAPEVLMESIIKDGIAKLKSVWAAFIAKVQAFYKKVINYFKSLFMNGEKFVKEFKQALANKAKDGEGKTFKYKMHNYSVDAGDKKVDEICGKIETKMTSYINGLAKVADFRGGDLSKGDALEKAIDSSLAEKFKGKTASEVAEEEIKELKFESTADMTKEVAEAYGIEGDKEEKEGLSASDVDAFIKFVLGYSEVNKKLTKDLAAFEDNASRIIKNLDSVGKKSEPESDQDKFSAASKLSSVLSGLLTWYKIPCNVRISAMKEIYNAYIATLKTFYRFKPSKATQEATAPEMIEDEGDIDDIDDVEEGTTATSTGDAAVTESMSLFELAAKYR